MRAIKKDHPNKELSNRHKNPPNSALKAKLAWKRFKSKGKVSKALYKEQYGLCGYSEISIDNIYPIFDENHNEISPLLGSHIEHIEPKSKYPLRTFDHLNLILSAIDSAKLKHLNKKDVFGGHKRLDDYSPSSFIFPLNENCAEYFHYETSGKVVPSQKLPNTREKAKARLTIYILNLNAPILVNLRRKWLTQLDKLIDETDKDALMDFAEQSLVPVNDTLRPFHSAQRQMFGNLGEIVCQKHEL
ncbi:retron system putative HNH endonuclease [Vibrio cyclitrophicus]